MDLMQTPLGDEVRRIINGGNKPSLYLDATIHTKLGDVGVLRVLNHDIVREYIGQYSDEISLVAVVPAGQMAYRVYPSRNELELTLVGAPTQQYVSAAFETNKVQSQRYRAVLKVSKDPAMEAMGRELVSEFKMDISEFEVVEFQLFSLAMEQFSMRSCGNSYRKTGVADIVRSLLLEQSNTIDIENAYKPLGVDMVEPFDAALREHIVIPHGTPVYDAPGYIHKNCGGIYSAGLAYFYQDDYWYVFPPYDYKNFNNATRQLVINQVPANKLPSLENSFLIEGSVVNIITTGEFSLSDVSDNEKRSSGNGVRFADASKLFEDGVEVVGNKAVMSRAKTNNEFVSSAQRSDLNNVVTSGNRVTANTLYEASKLASKEGVHIQAVWQNANPALIRPGMQSRIFYFKEGQVRKLDAVVIGIQSSSRWDGQGLVAGRYVRNVAVHLFAANEANQ